MFSEDVVGLVEEMGFHFHVVVRCEQLVAQDRNDDDDDMGA